MKEKNYIDNKFTNIYPLSKTLRFELKPVGKNKDHLEDFKSEWLNQVIQEDDKRADNYRKIKPSIDDYHREWIEEKLAYPGVDANGFEEKFNFEEAFKNYKEFKKFKKEKEEWEKSQKLLRKNLVKCYFSDKDKLFKADLIEKELPDWLKKMGKWEDNKSIVESFNKFTTYFKGFNENRKNMYSDKDQGTAIANRLMNENLPRFFKNCIIYEEITEKHPELVSSIKREIKHEILNNLGVEKISEVFQPNFFIKLFTQTGIDSFRELLGGKTEQDGTKHQGLNELINLYRQKKSIKPKELPDFTKLYKQILSDRETTSFRPESFKDDKDMLGTLGEFIERADGLVEKLTSSLKKLEDADLARTYIKTDGLSQISTAMFKDWKIISNALESHAETIYPIPNNRKITKKTEKQRKDYSKQNVFSLEELDTVLTEYMRDLDSSELRERITRLNKNQPILHWIANPLENAKKADTDKDKPSLDESINKVVKELKLLGLDSLNKDRRPPNDERDKGGEGYRQVRAIREMLDGFMELLHSVEPLYLVKKRKRIDVPDIDTSFYSDFEESYENYREPLVTLYNKVRNHLTKKPFSSDKIKINFNTSELLNGWDVNKETTNLSILFEKEGQYFLGIMHRNHKKIFDYVVNINDGENHRERKNDLRDEIIDTNKSGYRKIVYKLLPGASKMLPKVFFSKERKKFFSPSAEVNRIRNTASHTKNGKPQTEFEKADFNRDDCHTMIDFYKESIKKHHDWRQFNFTFKATCEYEDLSEFYRDIEDQGYKIEFDYIKESYIDGCVKNGKLILFQIYNKDFSIKSKGRPNLHTLYWKGLFEEENLNNVVLKLNGEAEIFYRQHSIERKDVIVHKTNKPIENKNNPNKKHSQCKYDIVKDKRYTQDKFLFHVPITLNFKGSQTPKLNDKVNCTVRNNKDIHIIGIDRGERHLLYYTVINRQGDIIKQGTLNEIDTDQGYEVNYQQKLHDKEQERDKARRSWSSIENIKELKAGYLSHVTHKLAKLIIEHNAIVCLEDLNFGFKRGRFKVEKQVYQKFERSLIDKLNYLVFKDRELGQPGHYLKAYQLTAPFESFKKLGKQSGILYYVQAAYTSKIDPATGFINFFGSLLRYENRAKSEDFLKNMKSIRYNQAEDNFEFQFDYSKYPIKQDFSNYQTEWIVCTHGNTRYSYDRNDKETIKTNVTEELKVLLDEKVDYKQGGEIKDDIAGIKATEFYKKLYWLLRLTLSLRHSVTGTKEDFILSPVKDKNSKFFDSREATEKQPQDADANGAYHIALKGIWILDKIDAWDPLDEKNKLNLAMKNKDWFNFIQDRVNQTTSS